MADIVMAYIVMAYIVMATLQLLVEYLGETFDRSLCNTTYVHACTQ